MFAICEGHDELVVKLMKHKTLDMNLQDGDTALMLATRAVHVDSIVELLKGSNLDVDRQNKYGQTATDLAKRSNHHEIVRCLEDHAQAQGRSHRIMSKNEKLNLEAIRCLEDHAQAQSRSHRRETASQELNLEKLQLNDCVGSLITAAIADVSDSA